MKPTPKDPTPTPPTDSSSDEPTTTRPSRSQPLDEPKAVEDFRQICPRPPTDDEIERYLEIVRFWHNYHNPQTESDLVRVAGGLLIENPADTETRARPWLWPGYIKGGDLTLLVGDSGHGKSTLMTEIGRLLVTWPKPWPWPASQITPAADSVIYLSREEDRLTEFAPRVKAMAGHEADIALKRMFRIRKVAVEGGSRDLELPGDIPRLKVMIQETRALGLSIDPLNSYFRTAADLYKEKEVRQVLEPLLDLGHQTGAAILPAVHLGKGGEGKNALDKILNSVAYKAVPRAILGVSILPEDRDKPDDEKRRIFGGLLSNIGPLNPSLIFTIDRTGVIRWQGPTDRSVAAAIEGRIEKEDTKVTQGRDAIIRILRPGEKLPAAEINKVLTALGINHESGTATRIRDFLGLVTVWDQETKQWVSFLPGVS